ncbi:hypothetical protein GUJ93_ZPchr0008g13305 [Zizania palustris]|uniref:Uncharacterized protein n=1 Tax=Zizania palustris TaxID=103762 RepID=A0A8J5V593_ZIZPA|nr:hypothetical protein GUJ93_ZPchr0008g13305 [Zizania palustris]
MESGTVLGARKQSARTIGEKKEKDSSDDSDNDDDEKASSYEQEVVNLLEQNSQELKYREKLLRGAKKRIDELESELAMTNGKIESLSSSPCLGDSGECPNCEVLLCDLKTLKSRYTERVDERDTLATELESAQQELKDAHATVVASCVDCPSHLASIAELRAKSDEQLSELAGVRGELEQTKLELETLLVPSTVCENCLSIRMELIKLKAEKSVEVDKECEICLSQVEVLASLREELGDVQNENFYLRSILSWISAKEPQLGMMIQ